MAISHPLTKISALVLLIALPALSRAQTQSSTPDKKQTRQKEVKNMIGSQYFSFIAQTAMPQSGRTIQLSSGYYDLQITKTSVNSFLPYYGQDYQAPMDPTKGGIKFTSKDFDYTATPGKKGGWDILIKPKDQSTDVQSVQQLSLSVSDDGYATLQVLSTNRQAISFYGVIASPDLR